ncbi:DUF305 domain-containing protein [Sinomonas terrae]|uniref:DUF305 domain-containing protein n=1 Tax=Sinomonas terrae TaxID=2908838 RepID=A0ABS9TWM2_9MICC|nr:DUF305 domain-containing protein [Sinomonas terrae]MCH6468770.1 DUF305 domain-containing protein [Sinomonas terrae]
MTTLQHTHARRRPLGLTLLAVGALALAGCGAPAATPASTATADIHSGHSMPSASAGFNSADGMFAQMMIPHHEQAVQMSEIVLAKPGLDPRVVALAQQIRAAQAPEIATLKDWLAAWGQPESMPGHGAGEAMSGMMKDEDLGQLRSAEPAKASKLFLTQMIAHHEGAVEMARTETQEGQDGGAVGMASAIVASQSREIEEMKAILAQP